MFIRRKRETRDQRPQGGRAAIYLCKDGTEEMEPLDGVPSIERQRELCRHTATALGADVVGEFTDGLLIGPRPGLQQVLRLVCTDPGIDHLIVVSRDRLTIDLDQAFDIAWCLGSTGTVLVTINAEGFPQVGATEPSRN